MNKKQPKFPEINVTREIFDKVVKRHREQCGPKCDHNLAAEAIAVAIKEQHPEFCDIVVDTGVLPSGRRTVIKIP